MITYAVHRQDDGESDGVQYIQTTPNRNVVASEQRTGESQRAEHREDHQWRMKSSGLRSRRGDVEHRIQRGQEQQRRLGRSRFPRGRDSERHISLCNFADLANSALDASMSGTFR
jgi:hypothetical protein